MGLIMSPTIYSITSPLEVISLMEIVVLCFVYTILTQLVFFFFSCYAEIFIVNASESRKFPTINSRVDKKRGTRSYGVPR